MKHLKSYQASRQQNGRPQIHLVVYNLYADYLAAYMGEKLARENVHEKSLLTGE